MSVVWRGVEEKWCWMGKEGKGGVSDALNERLCISFSFQQHYLGQHAETQEGEKEQQQDEKLVMCLLQKGHGAGKQEQGQQ